MWSAWLIDLLHLCVSCCCFFFSLFVCSLFFPIFLFLLFLSVLSVGLPVFFSFSSYVCLLVCYFQFCFIKFVFPSWLGLMLCERKIYKGWLISTV